MKFSIGLRLFIAVLMAILSVALLSLLLLGRNINRDFSEYALAIELDRLQELSESLSDTYANTGSWDFIPATADAKREWLSQELLRLHYEKHARPPMQAQRVEQLANDGEIPQPPLPPPPLPPLPAPPEAAAPADVLLPDLFARISLLDSNKHYLAGRPVDNQPSGLRPLLLKGKTIGYLQVVKALQPTDQLAQDFLHAQRNSIWLLTALGILLSALVASLLAAHFRRPLLSLVEGARQLSQGQFTTRLDSHRSDEIGELAQSFNHMAGKLEQAEQMRRQWVADTSHELRTPLTIIRGQIEAIRDGIRTADNNNLGIMLNQISSLDKLIDELYTLARADVGELRYDMEEIDFWSLAIDEASSITDKLQAAGLHLQLDITATNRIVHGDPQRLRQVFRNFFQNTLRYTTSGGQLQLSACNDNQRLIITLDDSAPAVPEDALAHLGERFYRVDKARNPQHGGAGLGLALCKKIVAAHAGTLTFAHSPLGGLRVQVSLPLSQKNVQGTQP